MKPTHRFGAFGIFVFSMSLPLAAQSTWNGSTSVNWSTPANWTPGIPAPGDNIIIADTTANQLTLDDGSHTVGSVTIGTNGTRTSGFTLQTNVANTLTIAGGITANGAFTNAIGTRFRGNYVFSADQTIQVLGAAGAHAVDAGIAFNEVSTGNFGSVLLNANVNKTGTGQLTFGALNLSGAGDLNINDGSVKLNAGGSMLLTVAGTGKIAVNNSGALILSKNSGTFSVTRPLQFNNTARLETGGTFGTAVTTEFASNMEWNGIHTITNNNSGVALNTRFTGIMSGGGSITKNGSGQLVLAGTASNTLGGNVTVSAGELRLDKTGAIAVPGNIFVTGGTLNVLQSNQIGSTSTVTLTGGTISASSGRTQTLAALNLSTNVVAPSVSGFTVTGATTITSGTAELNSGQTFTTNTLSISNNSTLRLVGNNGVGTFSTINVGAGGLALNGSKIQFGNVGSSGTQLVNLAGDLTSSGTSLFTVTNFNGPRLIDLQAGSRTFAITDGSLEIRPAVQNGTLVKSGAGTLILSQPGSTADFSFTEGPVRIGTQATAGNVTLSGGSLLMEVGGATPAKITTTGNFTSTGGTIELSSANGNISPGSLEIVRYGGALVGNPTVNVPPQLATSRMAPVVNYGTGNDSSITLTTTALPVSLTWQGSKASGLWDTNNTANFNGGTEKFFSLDSVTFDDSGTSASILLNSAVFPADVVFNHGATRPTYTLTGTGSISGPTNVTKMGTGTTVIATDNAYTGTTNVQEGILQVGNNGPTGSLGSGGLNLEFGTTLKYARTGTAIAANVITGSGTITNSGTGTVAFTANSPAYFGEVTVTAGTLQLGNGGADGSLASASINVAAGTTLAIKRTGVPTIANFINGNGSVIVSGGSPILTTFNSFTGGVTVTDGGVLRVSGDFALGELPAALVPNAIRLTQGGLKNQDVEVTTEATRGVTISGEAYFTGAFQRALTISGPITGTGDVFINHDNGTVRFASTANNWVGTLTLGADKPGSNGTTGGNLEISTLNSLGTASAAPANWIFNGGRLIYTGENATTDRGFTLEGAGSINVTTANLTISGQATGPGAFTKVGDGTLVFSGANDFLGNVVVDDGVLALANATALGATAKTLVIAGDAAGNRLPEVQLSGGLSIVIDDIDISGAGAANLTGALHNVSGDNTVTITNDLTMRTGNGSTTLFSSAGTLTLNAPLVTSNATGRALILGGAGNGVINGTVANGSTAALPVTKAGAGKWTLNGTQTYTGATAVNEGTLSLGQASLNDTAAVTVAAGAVLNLNFSGTDQVGSLTLDGVVQADGVYDAANTAGLITGSGSLRVGAGPEGYTSWAAGFPFSMGVNDGATQDADSDGISNLMEYVLGGIPVGSGAANTSILPTQSLTATDLVLTFRRSDLSEADVTLKVQWSSDLMTWTDFATIGAGDALPAVDVTEDSPTPALDTVVVTIPRSNAVGGKIFARVQAVK